MGNSLPPLIHVAVKEMTMTQTVLIRVAGLLKALFPFAQPSAAGELPPAASGARPDEDRPGQQEGRFSRDEAWYWAMHSHW